MSPLMDLRLQRRHSSEGPSLDSHVGLSPLPPNIFLFISERGGGRNVSDERESLIGSFLHALYGGSSRNLGADLPVHRSTLDPWATPAGPRVGLLIAGAVLAERTFSEPSFPSH